MPVVSPSVSYGGMMSPSWFWCPPEISPVAEMLGEMD